MINYTLKCANDHRFDSWFQSSDAFSTLKSAGMVVCPTCNSAEVSKAIMAPRIRTARGKAAEPVAQEQTSPPPPSSAASDRPLSTPTTPQEKALAELKAKVESSSEYVGMEFAKKAREIHDGDMPARPIYGETSLEDAKKLIEDGVPVAPLPFTPSRKTN